MADRRLLIGLACKADPRGMNRGQQKNEGGFKMCSWGINHGSLSRFRKVPVVLLLTAVGAFPFACPLSEQNFPAKPIQIFIPYGAGGVANLTMRLLAQKLTQRTKQQVVIENRPGAGGLLAA